MTLFEWLGTALPEHKPWMSDALVAGIYQATSGADTIVQLRRKPKLFQTELYKNVLATEEIATLEAGFSWPGKVIIPELKSNQDNEIDPEVLARGRQQFLNLCANCHGTKGEGLNRFAPPLKDSEWVLGEDYKLAMIMLHGMEGAVQVNNKTYDIPDILPNMPSFTTLQDSEISAIATYIRNAWGNTAEPIKPGRVGAIRFRTQGKLQPWKSTELDTLNFTVN
jgi:mono/diheme cytochrome c family protein